MIVMLLWIVWITGGFKKSLIPKAELYYPMSLCVTVEITAFSFYKAKLFSLLQFFCGDAD